MAHQIVAVSVVAGWKPRLGRRSQRFISKWRFEDCHGASRRTSSAGRITGGTRARVAHSLYRRPKFFPPFFLLPNFAPSSLGFGAEASACGGSSLQGPNPTG